MKIILVAAVVLIVTTFIEFSASSTALTVIEERQLSDVENLALEINKELFNHRHKYFPLKELTNKRQRDIFLSEVGKDTVAIRIDTIGELYVAANIKTRYLPYNRKTQQFDTKEFGLNQSDHAVIINTVYKDPKFRNWVVHIIEPTPGSKATNPLDNAKPHAEMQLLSFLTNLHGSSLQAATGVVAASKPPCIKCAEELKHWNMIYSEKQGYKDVQNWLPPNEIPGLKQTIYKVDASKLRSFNMPDIKDSLHRSTKLLHRKRNLGF